MCLERWGEQRQKQLFGGKVISIEGVCKLIVTFNCSYEKSTRKREKEVRLFQEYYLKHLAISPSNMTVKRVFCCFGKEKVVTTGVA